MWLVVVDTTQIQPYVFGSNRLRENVGASYLVDAATGAWAFQTVKEVAPAKHNIEPDYTLNDEVWIENGLDAEVLYSGGGNFVVLFSDFDKVKRFNRILSQRILQEAPGLQLVIAQQEMQWSDHVLRDKLSETLRILSVQKRSHAWSAPLLGLSVTASCRSTGFPATGIVPGVGGEPGYLASDEVQAKVEAARPQHSDKSAADQRLQRIIKLPEAYRYPADFENLGATVGEYSYMAVVHADGNAMGQRIAEIGRDCATAGENRKFVQALRNFSRGVQQAAEAALKITRDRLIAQIFDKDGGKCIVHESDSKVLIQIRLKKDKSGFYYIPFRPIVFGGDDTTFVCDGRLGLSLATVYLQEFEQQTQTYLEKFEQQTQARLGKKDGGLTACAGIAIVKYHYPFARAYALAADLTRSAKHYREDQHIAGSCLDWHFALSGLGGSIEEIRNREYTVDTGSLTLRPVTLMSNSKEASRAWPVVLSGIQAFQKEEWTERRNKIKALRDALREGPGAVEHFVSSANDGAKLPQVLSEMTDWPARGWQGHSCGYFDAIELADWFVPLKGAADETPTVVLAP